MPSMPIRSRLRDAAYGFTGRYTPRLHHFLRSMRRPNASVDAGVVYPSYKSFDELIDVERLKSLDGFLKERVRAHLSQGQVGDFYTGRQRLRPWYREKTGSKTIELSSTESDRPYQYFELDRPELWRPTPNAEEFKPLMDFIATLPFKQTARMLIMCDDTGHPVNAHRDHSLFDVLHEFIWFRTDLAKPFYLQDWKTKRKLYVESYSAWFDTVNQYHGADRTSELSISIRVDGRFTDELWERIPRPSQNRSSTPALWAAAGDLPAKR
jgi:hypothetical protein